MELKNEALQNLWVRLLTCNSCYPKSVINLFIECDEAIEGGMAAIKAELTEANQRLNNERKHGEDLADVNGQLASENVDLKAKLSLLGSSRVTWRSRAQHAEKEIEDLIKKISDLEEENANLRVTPPDTNVMKKIHELEQDNETLRSKLEAVDKANDVLRSDNKILWSKLEEADISKRPWHGDGNAMTGGRTCCESLSECIEFQNKKIEELEAEKTRLKEAYDIQETTIKRLKLLLGKEHKEKEVPTGDHEFEFGDKVFVPWSYQPYMYIKRGMTYNPRTERLVYVGKDQHLKWFGERFEIK